MRTASEIQTILETAKLDRNDLLPLCQEILFDENFSGTELRLVELEDEVLESIKVGDRLVIRGDGNDSAVLCNGSGTFEIKEAETSNSLLILGKVLLPEELQGENLQRSEPVSSLQEVSNQWGGDERCEIRKIINVVHSYLELRRTKPILGKIYSILEPVSYRGPHYEKELVGIDYGNEIQGTLEEILEKVPASQKEIEEYLSGKLRTCVLKGKIRLVQSEYLFEVLSRVLDCVDSNSWDRMCISRNDVINELDMLYPRFIIEKVFEWFFVPGLAEISENKFAMNQYEICRFLGEAILKSMHKFKLSDFKSAWQQSVPEGLSVELGQLDGLALCDTESNPATISYFPEDSLPDTIQERFAVLFEAKSKWTYNEILPFLSSLAFSTHNVGILLAKHTRVHTTNNRKYYCAKHSK